MSAGESRIERLLRLGRERWRDGWVCLKVEYTQYSSGNRGLEVDLHGSPTNEGRIEHLKGESLAQVEALLSAPTESLLTALSAWEAAERERQENEQAEAAVRASAEGSVRCPS